MCSEFSDNSIECQSYAVMEKWLLNTNTAQLMVEENQQHWWNLYGPKQLSVAERENYMLFETFLWLDFNISCLKRFGIFCLSIGEKNSVIHYSLFRRLADKAPKLAMEWKRREIM